MLYPGYFQIIHIKVELLCSHNALC